jgi:predicted nucleotidyltransferase
MITIEQQKVILDKLSPYQPKKVAVFGSYARGENNKDSDLDLLVEFGVRINLLDLIGLEQDLSEILGVKVDLVTVGGLSPYIKPYVEKDLKSLL